MPKPRRTTSIVAALPVALGLLAPAAHRASAGLSGTSGIGAPAKASSTASTSAKEFSVQLSDLQTWSQSVVVTLDRVQIEGHSKVHPLADDCEMHLGAHASDFTGDPDGLVLEPMNACVQPFPGKATQSSADWTAFGDQVLGKVVSATGVPRIWPEHLDGGTASNPDHAVELHPMTSLTTAGRTVDFAPNVFAGEYRGGVGEPTALSILQNTTVGVVHQGAAAEIRFHGGRIGNFTVLTVDIHRASIRSDGSGSFRMDGDIATENGESVPVRVVTIKGTPINDTIGQARGGTRPQLSLEALVLFSLSPESLFQAVNQSTGSEVPVLRPIQLILYGTPGDHDQ